MNITHEINSRVEEIAKVPSTLKQVSVALGKTVVGIIALGLTIPTLGLCETINTKSRCFNKIVTVLPLLFERTIKIINPSSKLSNYDITSGYEYGVFAKKLEFIDRSFFDNETSKEFMNREIFTRGIVLVGQPFFIIAMVADFALGCIAATFAIILCGSSATCNNFAIKHLKSIILIGFPLSMVTTIIYPHWA